MLAASTQENPYFDTARKSFSSHAQPRYDLPSWKVGDSIISAKDEKTAIKYAKKRGLWKEGLIIEKVEK